MPLISPPRSILHLDVDAFFASVEQRDDPKLRGRPVAVGTGVVASCSYEARRWGVSTGMRLSEARVLCRPLIVIPGDYRRYEQAARRMLAICQERTPQDGTISEVELHTMRNRLDRGKMYKAERGELFMCLPIGDAWSPSKEVILEPDEQARNVVQLIFDKFAELGSTMAVFRYLLEHDIKIGVRPHDGPNPGVLTWRRASRTTIFNILRHPMYAGTYVYGRCPIDHKRRVNRNNKQARQWVPREEWKVVIPDGVPAYITQEQ